MPFVYSLLLEIGISEKALDGHGMLSELWQTAENLEEFGEVSGLEALEQTIDEMKFALRKIEKDLKAKYG